MTKPKTLIPMLLLCAMFFAFGFVTWVNAILIPFFKTAFELDHFTSYLVAFAFYISYLVISLPAAYLLKRRGFKTGMSLGFLIMATGTMLFVPAAYFKQYAVFLLALLVIGTGLAIVQTAVNPYVTLLGKQEHAARRISIMGICNKVAGIIAPVFLGSFIFLNKDQQFINALHHMQPVAKEIFLTGFIRRVIPPYIVVSLVLAALGALVRLPILPEIEVQQQDDQPSAPQKIIHYPHLILGALAIFFHVGSQVVAIDTVISYTRDMGLPMEKARYFPSAVLFMTICGYFLGIVFVPWKFSQLTALRICSSLGLSLSVLVLFCRMQFSLWGHTLSVSVIFLTMLGLANSMIWACIWPLSLDRLGNKVRVGSSLLIMGLCGNAIMPLIYGYLADHIGLQNAYVILLPCYAYLVFFAIRGYKLNTWKLRNN
ncbi:sugar MFS transporter [Mucilaginibacter sp. SMC90]|uniref:sugar MFS transporter n=1 Tax=Mucilaginibacter sp. SMC90 TaxID=2929803 RepID=UPI001FB5374A|nr:sugar MFS transporter [Mucilaginibacter sp. SMC90]UOE46611.1 sugar MFS transporter [Mucilaginibacter sp. SMC90]